MKVSEDGQQKLNLKRIKYDRFDLFCSRSPSEVEQESPIKNSDNISKPSLLPALKDKKTIDDQLYYIPTVGEIIKDRYKVTGVLGKGVYSIVLEVEELHTGKKLALKVLRANEQITSAGRKELDLLNVLNSTDLSQRRFIIRVSDSFTLNEHLAIVMELLKRNLREEAKSRVPERRLNLKSIQRYGFQLIMALAHLKSNGIVHLDSELIS